MWESHHRILQGKTYHRNVKDVLSNCEDNEMALRVVQLLMAHFGEDLTGIVLLTNVSATAADVETPSLYLQVLV
ncbi:hypothetical protein F7725_018294 [Dissostichus mawsoni]|uniref:Uncharacterized protein n=1 Tax=Dissostichus mawsoni TaxID=36200 RepID=A0A7J5XSN5_DISMA|nr:hypothetical protein F7725_018294 [Dissostichus mawsoni]